MLPRFAASPEDPTNYAKKAGNLTVRLCRSDVALAQAQREAYRSLLPDEEQRRASELPSHEADAYLMARALLRSELARVTGEPPHKLPLTSGSQGKPALMGGPQFNLSHTAGWLALAISQDVPLGIDIEALAPRAVDPLRLAQRFFTAAESRALAGLPAREQLAQFCALWTLKEAFSKSLGEPVVEHLTRLEIEYRPGFLSVRHDDLQTRASLALYPLQADACLAICVSDHPGDELQCTPQLSIGAPLQTWCRISPRGTGTRLFSHLATV